MDSRHVEFIEENRKLLEEKQALEHEIKLMNQEILLYKRLCSKILALVKSRETFNETF
jgi:hypothetical protein